MRPKVKDVLLTIYNASNPAASASLAVKPSKTPGATTILSGSSSNCRRRFAPVSGVIAMLACAPTESYKLGRGSREAINAIGCYDNRETPYQLNS